jgi:diguanylate cyclase (GGDEF)-like protein
MLTAKKAALGASSGKGTMNSEAIDTTRPDPLPCERGFCPVHCASLGAAAAGRLANGEPGCIAMQDFDTLLRAVCSRLRSCVGDAAGACGAEQMRSDVLECGEALEQLHAALAHERMCHTRLHQSATALQERLTAALSELAATRVGQESAQHCALHDDLTSLPNRRFFRQQLDRALRGRPEDAPALAVLYLDLDGMKAVNDTYGHRIGDQLLIVVASRLVRTLRSTDVVSRVGGDEFALLLADLPSADDVAVWAARLCAAVSAPVQLGGLQLRVQASIGIAMCPEHGRGASALVHNADRAMYQAKRRRSGHAFFDRAAASCMTAGSDGSGPAGADQRSAPPPPSSPASQASAPASRMQ